jgi:hypothetical protein
VRIRLASLAAVAGVLVVVTGTGTGSALVTKPKKTYHCVLRDFNQSPGKTTGIDFGFISCSGAFGKGVQSDSYTEKVNATTGKISSHGAFKDFYNNGTVHGAYSLSGKLKTATSGTFVGALAVTGGTGAFRAAHIAGKMTCTTKDAGKTTLCTITAKGSAF